MNAKRSLLLSSVLVMGVVFPVSAHIEMLDPTPRHPRSELKDGPCGLAGGAAGPIVATYEPGQTIDIRLEEFVDHPSHYRVAIDMDGHDDLDDPICLTNCDDRRGPPPTFRDPDHVIVLANVADDPAAEQTITVTLPDQACDHCTLQLIQVMYDKRPYTVGGNDLYYRCADIRIEASAGTDAGVTDAGVTDVGVADVGSDVDADVGSDVDAGSFDAGMLSSDMGLDGSTVDASGGASDDEGGCSAASAHSPGWFWGLLLALVWRRRLSSN